MSIFGWSYPPGCHSVPGDEPSGPCEVCGGDVDSDKCICPECPKCGEQGNPACYDIVIGQPEKEHGMKRNKAQIVGRQELEVAQ